jgi:hypothetical protein
MLLRRSSVIRWSVGVSFGKLFAVCAIATAGSTIGASATTLYSINWLSDAEPCSTEMTAPLHGPIVSRQFKPCVYPDLVAYPLSICPGQMAGYPWDRGEPILILGYHLSAVLSSPDSKAIIELGTGSNWGSADVFATAAGTGTFTSREWFPPGMVVPTGGDHARIDVYGSCGGAGTFNVLVTIFYVVRTNHD